MKTEETRELVLRFYGCRDKNDAEGIRALVAADAVWHLPPSVPLFPEVIEGNEAIAAAMTGGDAKAVMGIDNRTWERKVEELIVEGSKAVVLQPLRVMTVDGKPYENVYAWLFFCENDRIVRMIEFTDTLHQARRFGWT